MSSQETKLALAKVENLQLRQAEDITHQKSYQLQVVDIEQARNIAGLMVAATDSSHPDHKLASKALLILGGMEMGMSAIRATQELFIDTRSGKIGQHVKAIVNEVERDPRYGYEIVEISEEKASVKFFKNTPTGKEYFNKGKPLERTKAWATKVGKFNTENKNSFVWKTYTENMLLWQCIRDGAKFFMTGLFNGYGLFGEDEADEIAAGTARHPEANIAQALAEERATADGVEDVSEVQPTREENRQGREQIAIETGNVEELKKIEEERAAEFITNEHRQSLLKAGQGRWKPTQMIDWCFKKFNTPADAKLRLTFEQADEARAHFENHNPE